MSEYFGRCVVCGGNASVNYPLLSGSPNFCSAHHNPHDAGPFGCDFTGPDDFDIPDEWPFEFFHKVVTGLPRFDAKKFVWTDREGVKHKLRDIDDAYLTNIINYLERRVNEMNEDSAAYWGLVRTFLLKEAKSRGVEVFCG